VPTRTRIRSRPSSRTLDEYIGQDRIRDNLQVSVAAARGRDEALDHVLLYGPPGLGKTTLAYVIGAEMGVSVRATAGPVIEKARRPGCHADQHAGQRSALHRRDPPNGSRDRGDPLSAMEDFELDIVIGEGPGARS
jgi:Holliday junction DNA helicase RuvB